MNTNTLLAIQFVVRRNIGRENLNDSPSFFYVQNQQNDKIR
jgi:hypothetical protein